MADPINPLGRPAATLAARSRPRAGSGPAVAFDMSIADTPEPVATTETGPIGAVNPMLLHELALDDEERRDREAQRHGGEVLDMLAELQRALLGPNVDASATERLERLVEDAPEPSDPRLGEVTRSILLRARIEIARRRLRPPTQD